MRKNVLSFRICMFGLLIALIAGCGKSADDLYNEGKAFAAAPETADYGIDRLERFIEKHPGDPRVPDAKLTLASIHQAMKRYQEAVVAFEELFSTHPETRETYKGRFLLGYMYFEDMGETEKAKQVFKEFIAAYPDSELTISAGILVENIDVPVEDWTVVKELERQNTAPQ